MDKKSPRSKRAKKIRNKICSLSINRLTIHRTTKHIYAQILSLDGSSTIVSASTVQNDARKDLHNGGNIAAAQYIGKLIAERSLAAGVNKVAFDRSGFKYHGRVKALAEAAREAGLVF